MSKRCWARWFNLTDPSHCKAKLQLDEIEELIVLVPQRDDNDEEFPTTVTTWDEVRICGKEESIFSKRKLEVNGDVGKIFRQMPN